MALTVGETIKLFEDSPKGMRCSAVRRALERLKFNVRDAAAGHRVISHPGLAGFHGANFNCGHGRNDLVKPVYIRNLVKVLIQWQDELEAVNGE